MDPEVVNTLLFLKSANNCWHFSIYEQDNFHAQLSSVCEQFYNLVYFRIGGTLPHLPTITEPGTLLYMTGCTHISIKIFIGLGKIFLMVDLQTLLL